MILSIIGQHAVLIVSLGTSLPLAAADLFLRGSRHRTTDGCTSSTTKNSCLTRAGGCTWQPHTGCASSLVTAQTTDPLSLLMEYSGDDEARMETSRNLLATQKPTKKPTRRPAPQKTPTRRPTTTQRPQDERPANSTFVMGDLTVSLTNLGIKVCTGMSARVIAKANQPVKFKNGSSSTLKFHSMADGAGIFPVESGYVYVSNSEMDSKRGGVYGLYFDNDGNIVDYKKLLSSTTRNCGGGRTPWDTWISCEETGNGRCWQVDPKNQRSSEVTKLGEGGNYESVAVDHRNPSRPLFFVTEDSSPGALLRYTPPDANPVGWSSLTATGGTTMYLKFTSSAKFIWTTNKAEGQASQSTYYPRVEGIDLYDGHLYFVSKTLKKLFILDLDSGSYKTSLTSNWGNPMAGGGAFNSQPDQIVRNGEYLYFTEDGGGTTGVYAAHKSTGAKYAIFEAIFNLYSNDETTGLAFSPNGTRMYAAFQDCTFLGLCTSSLNCGCLLEFSRVDGRSFDGSTLNLKHHAPETPATLF